MKPISIGCALNLDAWSRPTIYTRDMSFIAGSAIGAITDLAPIPVRYSTVTLLIREQSRKHQ